MIIFKNAIEKIKLHIYLFCQSFINKKYIFFIKIRLFINHIYIYNFFSKMKSYLDMTGCHYLYT